MNKNFLILLTLIVSYVADAQTVKMLNSGTKASLRGLSVVTDNIVWVSGSGGAVGKSIDGGNTWKFITVKGFEKTDFRDIEAFDENTAVIMGIAEPAYILKTIDGGLSWKEAYVNKTKGMFLDAIDFSDKKNGIVVGDPIDGKVFLATTKDGGNTWTDLPVNKRPIADSGEAFFASSGTNIRLTRKGYILASGGLKSNFIKNNRKVPLPILQGKESTGANSIASKNNKMMIVVGGDFNTKDSTEKNCFITKDGGKTWFSPIAKPTGYRSCIEYISNNTWITTGLNGTDISTFQGKYFTNISKESFHTVRKAKNGNAVFFSGGGGRIGKLLL